MKLFILTCVLVACLFSVKSFARDDIQTLPIQALLTTSKAKQALLDIPLYFADQSHNTIKTKYGEVITNKKTNAFNKTDREACEWVMLSALKALQERAVREGMNAVVNIQSYYKKREFVSQTEYQCGAGTFIAGVALKGTLVKL
ncbi:excinuclease ABC subunit A [Pseudoalteromonas shioyasakiensis]|uniref:excinuclease ABC subunit A n=1 Tax=Pseudoalteromonas TaxID=53246 RepID=UPI001430B958|nr:MULTISPECIES: excinuclease ABC subunit A [Pseudoalteromonas]MCQ8880395.1 excinuclease ABC subunit A [Pseudoalteromonas shioyasakiensis]NIZ04412.1 excinuclease ABC subunit A [Pseudoalteromonas sp. HF66]